MLTVPCLRFHGRVALLSRQRIQAAGRPLGQHGSRNEPSVKRLCPECHAVSGCWDAARLVHGSDLTVGPCDRCGAVSVLVQCYAYDFRART